MAEPIWAIGLMSGTSMDGVDAALLRTDGESIVEAGAWLTLPYEDDFRAGLRGILRGEGDVMTVERQLTERHIEAVQQLLQRSGMKPNEVGVIGFHGHTIQHRPAEGITWQIGNPSLLAEHTGIGVVADFRRRDVAAGGQGAPLVPLYHAALAHQVPEYRDGLPVCFLNIGGISNFTFVEGDTVIATDSGPGNCLLDDWIHHHTGHSHDADGAISATGTVDYECITHQLQHPFFKQPLPKSLDRLDFSIAPFSHLSLEQGAATLAYFTATAIEHTARLLPQVPARWLVCGGGRHNPSIMRAMGNQLGHVNPVEAIGMAGDAIEAQAFAYLAVRSMHGLPLSQPGTTGATRAVTGGAFYRA